MTDLSRKLKKLKLPKIKRENLIVVGLVVIALAIPLTVALAGVRQELRKGAAPSTGSILINGGAATTDNANVILTLTAPTQQASLFKSPLKVPQAYAIEDCFDSDDTDAVSGEFNYSTKGYVDDFGDRRWDVCFDENTLVEFYCKQAPGQNRPSRGATHHPCPNGCEDGKCKSDASGQDEDPTPTPTPECTWTEWEDTGECNCGGYPGKMLQVRTKTPDWCVIDPYDITMNCVDHPDCGSTPTPTPTLTPTPTPTDTPDVPTVTKMRISNSPIFVGSVEEDFAVAKPWTLDSGHINGTKTVYATFKWSDGTWTDPVYATIDLQTAAPTPTPTDIPPAAPTPTPTTPPSDGTGTAYVDSLRVCGDDRIGQYMQYVTCGSSKSSGCSPPVKIKGHDSAGADVAFRLILKGPDGSIWGDTVRSSYGYYREQGGLLSQYCNGYHTTSSRNPGPPYVSCSFHIANERGYASLQSFVSYPNKSFKGGRWTLQAIPASVITERTADGHFLDRYIKRENGRIAWNWDGAREVTFEVFYVRLGWSGGYACRGTGSGDSFVTIPSFPPGDISASVSGSDVTINFNTIYPTSSKWGNVPAHLVGQPMETIGGVCYATDSSYLNDKDIIKVAKFGEKAYASYGVSRNLHCLKSTTIETSHSIPINNLESCYSYSPVPHYYKVFAYDNRIATGVSVGRSFTCDGTSSSSASSSAPPTEPTPPPFPTPTPSAPPPTPPPPLTCADIDLNDNGTVDIGDIGVLVDSFDKSGIDLPGDFNGNGEIDIFDIDMFSDTYRRCTEEQ